MSIGQIFGSALGGALGGNSLAGNLAASTVGGLIGQKFVQVLATAMTADLSTVSLNDVFASQGISVGNAGIGAVSSFLTAELGHALHIDGFDGQLFSTAVSGFTTSLLIQVKDEMVRGGLDFAGAIAAIDWTQALSSAVDLAQLHVGDLLGSYLGHELVPAQTREGAIAGQLFGALGSFILPGGLGSLIGTILGTWIGNHFGTPASPSAVDLLDQAGYLYDFGHYQSADSGSYEAPDQMAAAAASIINSYLTAVHGAALDHSKQATVGYSKNPDVLYVNGTPGHTDRSFTDVNDSVHAVALDVLQHTEVIGGDLLMKRAHQNSPSNTPLAPHQSSCLGFVQTGVLRLHRSRDNAAGPEPVQKTDASPNLSGPDLQTWLEVLSAVPGAPVTESDILAFVEGPLRKFFPFEKFLGAYGGLSGGMIRMRSLVTSGYPQEFLSSLEDVFNLTSPGMFFVVDIQAEALLSRRDRRAGRARRGDSCKQARA
jgi:hypothetical protein